MATPSDVLHLKTDAELRFFVENPTYYQDELVQAAQQELRRRHPTTGPLPTPTAPPVAAEAALEPAPDEAAPRRPAWLLPASVGLVLLLAGLGFWGKTSQRPAAAKPRAVQAPPPPAPLETAISAPPLPTYDVENYVEQALSKVPAAEKANAQQLSQYQAISRRFWAAQQPSAYLLGQVRQNRPNPVFGAQSALVLDLWQEFDRTLIYSYDFGPVMSDHLHRMKTIARHQRAALTNLAEAAASHQPIRLTDKQLVADQQALPQLLAPLQPRAGAAQL